MLCATQEKESARLKLVDCCPALGEQVSGEQGIGVATLSTGNLSQ